MCGFEGTRDGVATSWKLRQRMQLQVVGGNMNARRLCDCVALCHNGQVGLDAAPFSLESVRKKAAT